MRAGLKNAFVTSAAGLVTALAFPPFGFAVAGLFGPFLLYSVNRRCPRFAHGYLFGLGLLGPLLYWLAEFDARAPWAAVAILALPLGLTARWATGPFSFACAFTGAEVIRSTGSLALPWGQLGSAFAATPFRCLAPWIGSFGLTFLAALVASFLRERPRTTLLVAIPFASLLAFHEPAAAPGETIRVAVVQGNFATDRDYEYEPSRVLSTLFEGTRLAARQGAKIVAWSETVILEYLNRPGAVRSEIERLAREEKIVIACGAPALRGTVEKRNAAFLFGTGETEPLRYDKVHLVPFGEYLPVIGPDRGHAVLPEGVGDFSPAPLPFATGRIGFMICFEGAFPYLARALSEQGARIFFNLSNDAWTHSRAEAEQHAALARLRVLEFDRPLVRAGNVGPSQIIDVGGRFVAEIGSERSGVIVGDVTLSHRVTWASLFGDWCGWLALFALPFSLTAKGLLGEVNDCNG